MSNNQFGNNLLYLLSEKKSLKLTRFKQYAEYLCHQNKPKGYDISKDQETGHSRAFEDKAENPSRKLWQIARNLSSLAYLDMGGKTGKTVVQAAAPALAELPFMRPVFFLTGARSPELLKTIKKSIKGHSKIEMEVKAQAQLPDSVIIKPESKMILRDWLEDTSFQGNKLSDYIKISEAPPAWSLLEFAGSLADYEESLRDHWFVGDKAHIKEIFNIDSTLNFKPFDADKDSLKNDLSLVKIFHQEQFYKYYLFSKRNENRSEVQLDWGRFLVMEKYAENSVLTYHKKSFEFASLLPLPFIFERGLALLSGNPPRIPKYNKKPFIFKNVPYKIALFVAKKLGQNLIES